MLSFVEFVKKENIKLDNLFVDKFWNSIQNNKPILLDDQIVRWLTSNPNAKIKQSRGTIKDKILKFKLIHQQLTYSDLKKKYFLIGSEKSDPCFSIGSEKSDPYFPIGSEKNNSNKNIPSFNKKNPLDYFETKQEKYLKQMKFILMNTDDFKMLCMMANTEKGNQITRYYITLEKAFKKYLVYQIDYKNQMMKIKDDKIDKLMELCKKNNIVMEEMNDKLDEIKEQNEELSDKIDNITEHVPFIPKNKKKQYIVILKLNKDSYKYKYYIIRSQYMNINKSIKKQKENFPNLKEILRLEDEPNPIKFKNAFYGKLKEIYNKKFSKMGNKFVIDGLPENNLINLIKNFNEIDRKKTVNDNY